MRERERERERESGVRGESCTLIACRESHKKRRKIILNYCLWFVGFHLNGAFLSGKQGARNKD
jgi:hypothetical protein